ncbi:MAG: S8 family serine peptidase, partial [Acidimicrobiales bacterium]
MRRILGVVVAVTLLAGLPAAAAVGSRPSAAPAAVGSPGLAAALDGAGSDHLGVLVHGTSVEATLSAIDASGLRPLAVFSSINVVGAVGTPAAVRRALDDDRVVYVEPDVELAYNLASARKATRADEAAAMTFDVDDATVGGFDGSGRSIAIIDSGIDGTHPMFTLPDGSSKVVRNLKVVCTDGYPAYFTQLAGQGQFPPPNCPADPELADALIADVPGNDSDTISGGGHGTHVAGIAAGFEVTTTDGRTFSGAAPGASLVGLSTGYSLSVMST